jgi:hypothetical protein
MDTPASMHDMLGYKHEPMQTAFFFMNIAGKDVPELANYLIERLQTGGANVQENGGAPYVHTQDEHKVWGIYINHSPASAASAIEVAAALDGEFGYDAANAVPTADLDIELMPKRGYGPTLN